MRACVCVLVAVVYIDYGSRISRFHRASLCMRLLQRFTFSPSLSLSFSHLHDLVPHPQNIIFSAYVDPDVTALMRRHCANTLGGLIIRGDYAGSIARVIPPVKQQFHRVPAASLAGADDARLKFFTDRILPALLEAATGDRDGSAPAAHTAIYVPSYFDYVRVRNLLDAREAEFVTASEYTEDGDITRARARFFAGDSPLLVLTERFHYFRRLRIRGIRNIVFYAPPNVAHHYTEMLNMLGEACAASLPVSSLVGA